MTAPPRQLIVCCDGTNNNLTGRLNDTNVTKLCELLDPDGQQQRLFYDPGVGNPGQLPGTTRLDSIKREVQRLTGLAFGQGIFENIAEGYTFLMQHYQDGDQIYLYGFSRGAFTARSIAGLVAQFGLLRPENQALLPTLLHTYFADRRESQRYRDVTAQVSALFCSPDRREVPVWFVGVWDTVASVGFPMLSQQTITARPSIAGKRYHHVRQALALDEHRRAFEPRPYIIEPGHDYAAHGQSIAQAWFSGSHGDVGGGYPHAEAGLCDDALRWMLQESIACGLRIDPALLNPRGELDDRALAERLALRSLCPRTEGADTAAAPCRQLHSETYDTPWWALAGLKLRDPTLNPDWNRLDDPVQPVEHPSVGQQPLQFAADTSWSRRRALGPLFWALLGLLVFDVLAGLMLAPRTAALDFSSSAAFTAALREQLTAAWNANLALAQWQLGWIPWSHLAQWPWPAPLEAAASARVPMRHLGRALLADGLLITSYAYLLARATSWAFARVARLRRAGPTPTRSRLLNGLGSAAGIAVAADLAENLFTWLVHLSAGSDDLPGAEYLFGLLMSGASALKWAGLAGCGMLVGWGMVMRVRSEDARGPR
jgi:hypothetical protein